MVGQTNKLRSHPVFGYIYENAFCPVFFGFFVAGQLEQERNTKSAKLELMIDGVHHYIMVNIVLKFSKMHSISFILNNFPVLKTCITSTAGFDGHPDLPVGAEDSLPP